MAKRIRKCNLIIDTCCDLPAELVTSFDVDLIRFSFMFGEEEHLDDLGATMSSHDFYERMRRGEQPTTAQVPFNQIIESFERALQSGIPTVYLCFTAALSGTFDTASVAAKELMEKHPGTELYVVDTKLPSVAEGLFVMEAVHQLDRGLTAQEMVAWANEARYYVNGFFTLPDLESLRRGGRIPDMAAVAGAKLDIKPILSYDIDGGLTFHGVARGRKKSIKQLLQNFQDRYIAPGAEGGELVGDVAGEGLNTVFVASADAPKEQEELAEMVLRATENKVALWHAQIGPTIGSHVGPGMIAVVFWGPDRRKHVSLSDRIANAVSGR
ncbi:MAG: DegV family protein [Coriobacteriia bacterium]|jgi:DegV family protein with EDD domain|nr:DegV family protein [Coriobacteriia bacterium]MDR2714453.1 DegV family protein [Coriobacteriales bacterium]